MVWSVLLSLTALAVGYLLGRRNKLKRLVKRRLEATTLGRLLETPKQRQDAAQAYLDPVAALSSLDHYAWDVAVTQLPFVGYAATPSDSPYVSVNRHHFRSSQEIETPKAEGRFRIFLTGGSLAFGSGAPSYESSIGGFLETILRRKNPGVEVFVAACPAWAGVHERIMIENRISDLEPDLIVSFSGNNDAHWAWNGKDVLWFRTYAENHFWKLINEAYRLVGAPQMPETLPEKKPVEDAVTVSRKVCRNISLSLAALKPLGTPYVYVLQPTIAVGGRKLSAREETNFKTWSADQIDFFQDCYRQFHRDLPALAEKESGFTFFDMTGVFDDISTDEELFIDAYHVGDKGYRLLAETMAPWLERFLPAK